MNQFEAAQVGGLQQLRVALTVGNLNNGDEDGWTALHLAALNGHDECIKFCIEMDANVNARNNKGCTPLHLASVYYWTCHPVHIVRVLLDAGALVDATDNMGSTPLYDAMCDKVSMLRDYSWIEERNCQMLHLTSMYQQFLIGSPHSLSRDPIVVMLPLSSSVYTNTDAQQ
jgi:hypothetical protein